MIENSVPTEKAFDSFINYAIKYLKSHYKKVSAQKQEDILVDVIECEVSDYYVSSHDMRLFKTLLKYRKNYIKPFKDLKPLRFSRNDDKIIHKINQRSNGITRTTIQSYVEAACNSITGRKRNATFKKIIEQVKSNLIVSFPMLKKEKRIKIEINAFRKLLHSKEQAKILLANHNYTLLKPQARGIMRKWLDNFNQKSTQTQKLYIHNLSSNAYHDFKRHQAHLRIIEYIAIPLIIFAFPDIVSDVLAFIVGGFFKVIGTGVMMYAYHFMDIEAIPRLIMAIVADGIAYAINRKRDE